MRTMTRSQLAYAIRRMPRRSLPVIAGAMIAAMVVAPAVQSQTTYILGDQTARTADGSTYPQPVGHGGGSNQFYNVLVMPTARQHSSSNDHHFGTVIQMVAPTSGTAALTSDSTALFTGMSVPASSKGSAHAEATVVEVAASAGSYIYTGKEIDLNNNRGDDSLNGSNMWDPPVPRMVGLNITSGGTYRPSTGLYIHSIDSDTDNRFRYGIWITSGSETPLRNSYSDVGIKIGHPPTATKAAIAALQPDNSADTYYAQRRTDSSPTGYFFRARDNGDSTDLFAVDVTGAITVTGKVVSFGANDSCGSGYKCLRVTN